MEFWNNLGKLAGEIVEKGINDLKKTAGDLKNLREEMENYFKRASFIPKNYEILWNGRSKEIDFRIFLMEGICK